MSFDINDVNKRAYHQELDGAALHKDSEEDHGEGGGEEELLVPHAVVEDHSQGEANRPPWIKLEFDFLELWVSAIHDLE